MALGFGHLEIDVDAKMDKQTSSRFLKLRGANNQTHNPDAILSEGELKAVAIADFLASLKVNQAFCGAIFDDPVTSLDHDIRKKVAKRLIGESKNRQIIIFTHDFVFLNDLMSIINEQKLDYTGHWVDRLPKSPGIINENQLPAVSHSLNVEEIKRSIQEAFTNYIGMERDKKIVYAISKLRRYQERFIIEKLFKKVVVRWEDKITVGRLKDIRWPSEEIIQKIIKLYSDTSKYEGGHLVSEESQDAPPEEQELLSLCTRTEQLHKETKEAAKKEAA